MARGKQREDAILTSTIELLGERGYEAITMDGVAARARASKATMYRRWHNKAELVKAALDSLDAAHNADIPDTGALRSDLLAVMDATRERATAPYLTMIQELVRASRRDEALAAALQAHVEDEDLSPFQAVLQRARARRQLAAGAPIELVHDVAEAMILRQLQTGAAFDAAFIVRVVDEVLLPLLSGGRRAVAKKTAAKADKAQTKTKKAQTKTEKPQTKTEKPQTKTEKPQTKTASSTQTAPFQKTRPSGQRAQPRSPRSRRKQSNG